MKKSLSTLCVALLLGGASSAFASSTDLTVTGIITPAACTPNLAGGGVVDFGKISAKDLNPTASTRLPVRTIELTVKCDAATQVALQLADMRAGSASRPGNDYFGLGLINGNEKLGFYQLTFGIPVADVPTNMIDSRDNGTTWFGLDDTIARVGSLVSFGSRFADGYAPDFVTDVTVDMLVHASIAPTNGLNLTDEQTIDGLATLQIWYR
jgi:type 1 fimbria pilin